MRLDPAEGVAFFRLKVEPNHMESCECIEEEQLTRV
jgi:hypothetical protein